MCLDVNCVSDMVDITAPLPRRVAGSSGRVVLVHYHTSVRASRIALRSVLVHPPADPGRSAQKV